MHHLTGYRFTDRFGVNRLRLKLIGIIMGFLPNLLAPQLLPCLDDGGIGVVRNVIIVISEIDRHTVNALRDNVLNLGDGITDTDRADAEGNQVNDDGAPAAEHLLGILGQNGIDQHKGEQTAQQEAEEDPRRAAADLAKDPAHRHGGQNDHNPFDSGGNALKHNGRTRALNVTLAVEPHRAEEEGGRGDDPKQDLPPGKGTLQHMANDLDTVDVIRVAVARAQQDQTRQGGGPLPAEIRIIAHVNRVCDHIAEGKCQRTEQRDGAQHKSRHHDLHKGRSAEQAAKDGQREEKQIGQQHISRRDQKSEDGLTDIGKLADRGEDDQHREQDVEDQRRDELNHTAQPTLEQKSLTSDGQAVVEVYRGTAAQIDRSQHARKQGNGNGGKAIKPNTVIEHTGKRAAQLPYLPIGSGISLKKQRQGQDEKE